jgi:iron complex transport system substrate-binding protein
MKKGLTIPVFLVLTIFLTVCTPQAKGAGNAEEPSQSTGAKANARTGQTKGMKKVIDMKGEAEIPLDPKRIVDVSGSADELIIMGIPFIASANTSMFDGMTVPDYLKDYFTGNHVEVVGNYGGIMDLNLEKIAGLKPDLIIMNIRHEKVYEQLKQIAPAVMVSDDMSFVNWKGRFRQLGEWFGKEAVVTKWLDDSGAKAAELSAKVQGVAGDATFAVIEANSVHFGSYYVYRTGGPGDLIFGELKLNPSAGVPEEVWGKVVDAEYFVNIDAYYLIFFSDDGKIGDTGNSPAWQNLKAVKNGRVYCGVNNTQYDMAYTPNGKRLYMEMLVNAIIHETNIE